MTSPSGAVRREALPPEARAQVRAWAIAMAAVVVVGAALAWVVPAHAVGDRLGSGRSATCAVRTGDATERDAVLGAVAPRTSHDARITAVRLIDPVNVALADAIVVPVVEGPDGGHVIFGSLTGWPLTEEQRAELTLDWSAERPVVGAHLTAGVQESIGLHVRVDDTSVDASYSGLQVEYRMLGARWVQTYAEAFLMPGGLATCPAAGAFP